MYRSVRLLFVTAVVAAAQQSEPTPTFRVGTKLVQVSVIAQDKQGNPVADLRREDFQIFDNGSPQEIRLFLGESEKSSPPQPKTPNLFTNQIASPEGSRSGYSVIVFDTLFTEFSCGGGCGSTWAREKAVQALQTLPPGDNVAIYATGYNLWVVREFTTDRQSLDHQLRTWKFTMDSIRTESKPAYLLAEIKQMVEHLAGIPGRKNLIWVATSFPISPAAVQMLKSADIALYPVDAVGSIIGTPGEKLARSAPLRALAAMTGGEAFFDRDDIDVAVHEALDDGRISYTLGFYPSGDDRASKVHQISVRISRPGVTLRYRNSYEAESPPPVSANPKADLVQALNRPIDATALPIRASLTRTQDRLNVEASLDVGSLELTESQNRWKARIDIVARFTTADGKLAGEVLYQKMSLNFLPATYASALQNGLVYHKELKIPPKAVDLKLLFANRASGKIGTLAVPLAEVHENETDHAQVH